MALEQDGELTIVGEAEDGDQVREIAAARPDVVLLDVSMPGIGGLDAPPQLRALVPDARIVVLSSFSAEEKADAPPAPRADPHPHKREPLSRTPGGAHELAQTGRTAGRPPRG